MFMYHGYTNWAIGCALSPGISGDNAHTKCCVAHVSGPTFWSRSNGLGFQSLSPLQGRHGGLHDSRFWALYGATPTLKSNLRHFQHRSYIRIDMKESINACTN